MQLLAAKLGLSTTCLHSMQQDKQMQSATQCKTVMEEQMFQHFMVWLAAQNTEHSSEATSCSALATVHAATDVWTRDHPTAAFFWCTYLVPAIPLQFWPCEESGSSEASQLW